MRYNIFRPSAETEGFKNCFLLSPRTGFVFGHCCVPGVKQFGNVSRLHHVSAVWAGIAYLILLIFGFPLYKSGETDKNQWQFHLYGLLPGDITRILWNKGYGNTFEAVKLCIKHVHDIIPRNGKIVFQNSGSSCFRCIVHFVRGLST